MIRDKMSAPKMSPEECKMTVSGPGGRKALFDVEHSHVGDFIEPLLFDDHEVWRHETKQEIMWVWYKGNLMGRPVPGHPQEIPDPMTLYSVDLLFATNNSVVQNIMRTLLYSRLPLHVFDHNVDNGRLWIL